MRGFCGKCGRTFDGQMLCPLCGIQLEEGEGTATALSLTLPPADDSADGPSFLRRLVFGTITLLGLYHGFKHLAVAAVLSRVGGPALPSDGHLSLLVLATLIASVVAGTVNRRAELTGLLLALATSAGFLVPDLVRGGELPEEWLIGVPTLLTLVGVSGGFAGRLMIPPAPSLPNFGRLDSRVMVRVKRRPMRVSWPQVILGATIAVGGTVFAEAIREGLSWALAGQGHTFGARALLAWQISMLAALVAGLAGSMNTRGGSRQVVFASFAAAGGVVLGLVAVSANGPPPVIEFWIYQLDLRQSGPLAYAIVAMTTFIATSLGGWFGVHAISSDREK
jgi:hypothetical protein